MNPCDNNESGCWGKCVIRCVVVVIACLIFAGLVAKMRQHTTPPPLGVERAAERAKALGELRATEADALQTPGWIDPTKGLVRLPIADAMKLAERAWQEPAKARADLIARATKAAFVPPPPPSPLE